MLISALEMQIISIFSYFRKTSSIFFFFLGNHCALRPRHNKAGVNRSCCLSSHYLNKQIPYSRRVILLPSASHWRRPIKRKEISPSARRLGGAEDQSYLLQSASGGTSPRYWTFWAAAKLGGVNDGASFYCVFPLFHYFPFSAKAVSVLPSIRFVDLLQTF